MMHGENLKLMRMVLFSFQVSDLLIAFRLLVWSSVDRVVLLRDWQGCWKGAVRQAVAPADPEWRECLYDYVRGSYSEVWQR